MDAAEGKRRAAAAALAQVQSGMRLGIGTGSTAEAFIHLLSRRIREEGLRLIGVPTSERTAALCRDLGVPLTTLEEAPELDLTIDGADEIDSALRLVKGGGGALLREKIVAASSARMIVIADASKTVAALGAFPLPIEINPFGQAATVLQIRKAADRLGLKGELMVRARDGAPFVTDGGHHIVDASFGRIPDPEALSASLHAVPGVVEHGLFIGLASAAVIARGEEIEVRGAL